MTAVGLDADTALISLGEGSYEAQLSDHWWVQSGPNGGYLTALILRAMGEEVSDPERCPRSLHVRFLKPPAAGPAVVRVRAIQRGRAMTTLSASLRQGDRDLVLASGTFSGAFSSIRFQDGSMPQLPPLDACPAVDKRINLNHRWDMRRAIGGDFRRSERALTGGYIRLAEPRTPDALTLAAVWDAWPPAVFARAIEQRFRGAVPTVEVSIHFRRSLPMDGLCGHDYLVLQTESDAAQDGFTEEVAHIWSTDGELLARARQIALLY